MRLKHVKRIGLIVAFAALGWPGNLQASKAGVVLERAQVSVLADSGLIRTELTLSNQLSSEVDAVELELSCEGFSSEQLWATVGHRAIGLAAGAKVSMFFSVRGPVFTPRQCQAQLLGYRLKKPTGSLIKMLLSTGFSADERAALLGAGMPGEHQEMLKAWSKQPVPETAQVSDVLLRLLSWYAQHVQLSDDSEVSDVPEAMARFDQPLQVVLSARERGTKYSSPIAFLVPSDASTMKDVLDGFSRTPPERIELFKEFSTENLKRDETSGVPESSSFYKKLSFGLMLGIILWTIWSWRRKNRLGVSEDV
jgi:hypothetical protein